MASENLYSSTSVYKAERLHPASRTGLRPQNFSWTSPPAAVNHLQAQSPNIERYAGNIYPYTYITGGTTIQGNIHGSIQNVQVNHNYIQGGSGEVTKLLESTHETRYLPSTGLNQLDIFSRNDPAQQSLSKIMNMLADVTDLTERPKKAIMSEVSTLLRNILDSDAFTLHASTNGCRDYLGALLDRSASTFDLAKTMRNVPSQPNRNSSSSQQLTLNPAPQLSSDSDSSHSDSRLRPAEAEDIAAPPTPAETRVSANTIAYSQIGPSLRNRKLGRALTTVNQHIAIKPTKISSIAPSAPRCLVRQLNRIVWQTQFGRVEVLTESKTFIVPADSRTDYADESKTFSTTVTITPTQEGVVDKQITIHASLVQSSALTSILPPNLTIRNVRPFDCELFSIVESGTVAQLRQFLEAGLGSFNDCSPDGFPLLGYALYEDNAEIVRFLLENGADPDEYAQQVDTPFTTPMLSYALGSPYITGYSDQRTRAPMTLDLLMLFGADPSSDIHALEESTKSLFTYYLLEALPDEIKCMLDKGSPFISVDAVPGFREVPLLELARSYSRQSIYARLMPDKFALLLARGANPSACDESNRSCLHICMYTHSGPWGYHVYQFPVTDGFDGELKDILLLLLTAGADPYARDEHGDSVSEYASDRGHEQEWIEALEECGYDVNDVLKAKDEISACSSGVDIKDRSQLRPLLTFAEYLEIRETRRIAEVDYGYEESDFGHFSQDGFDIQDASKNFVIETDRREEDDTPCWRWDPEDPSEGEDGQDMEEPPVQQNIGDDTMLDEADLHADILDAYKVLKCKSA